MKSAPLRVTLLATLALSLVMATACSNNSNNSNNGGSASPTATQGESASASSTATSTEAVDYYKFKEPVNVVFAKNVFDIKVYPEGEDPGNNAVYEMMEKTTNIKASNKFAVPYENYRERIKLGIASNDLPDIFFAEQADVDQLIKNDMLEDMKPYFDKYATDKTKEIVGYKDGLLFKGAQRADKIYGMPNVTDALNGSPVVYIRKDWMDKLGATMPKTFEELIDLAKRFAKEDPDGDGKPNTFGLSMNNQLDLKFTALMNAYGAYPKVYQQDAEGKLTYGSLNPNMKQGLTMLADLYKEGVIDKEFVTKDMPKSMELVSQGKVGILIGEFFSPLWPLQDVPKNVKEADFVSMPMPGLGGAEYQPNVPINVAGYFVVRKGFEHPEALIVLLNNLAETSYSNLDNEWAKAWMELNKDPKYANASINNWLPVFNDRPDANANRYNLFTEAFKSGTDENMPVDQRVTFQNVKKGKEGDAANWAWYKTFLEGVPNANSYKTIVYNGWFGGATETGKLKSASLLDLENQTIIKIIVGSAPVDSYDGFIKQYNDLGGKQIVDEMNAELASQK
ncbi:hypothetical protein [Cohnella sp. GCM10027633]|uniref:hypothetical protein n=1 Tax=unclassified Cohnella TaxID=2636738 RepID=UPI00362F133D